MLQQQQHICPLLRLVQGLDLSDWEDRSPWNSCPKCHSTKGVVKNAFLGRLPQNKVDKLHAVEPGLICVMWRRRTTSPRCRDLLAPAELFFEYRDGEDAKVLRSVLDVLACMSSTSNFLISLQNHWHVLLFAYAGIHRSPTGKNSMQQQYLHMRLRQDQDQMHSDSEGVPKLWRLAIIHTYTHG